MRERQPEDEVSYREKSMGMRNELRALNRLVPETSRAFAALSAAATEGGAIGRKESEFVALGIAVAQCCEPCITYHVEALMKAGATREELAGVLAMCVQMGGGPALMYAAHALAAWDEFAAVAD
ncbi:MAG: carboxymuconolactone decarboxylase family protein [Rhodobacteraceae bacterium]|nr:carboxymuconolactone decarboxylase family protein [Paracoccaceae bacterium]